MGEFYTIASTGDVVYVGSDLPCEYSGSLYTKKLNGTVAKAKANATQGIPELLEIAVGKHLERIVEISMIGMPNMVGIGMIQGLHFLFIMNYGEIERYNVFHASMIIRHANDGKMSIRKVEKMH